MSSPPARLPLFYSPLYTGALDDRARFPKRRYQLVHDELARRQAAGAPVHIDESPRRATLEELLLVHDPDYARAFLEGTLPRAMVRRIGFRPWTPEFVARTLTIAGASICALEHILHHSAPLAGNLAGGTHHAFADRGAGYCVFNDVAICARLALQAGLERVMVVDLDVHQGDGTAAIFADEPRVFTLSMHGARNWPYRKQTSDLDVPLPDGADDATALEALERHLPAALFEHQPELIIYQAGVDALDADALGRLAMTRQGMRQRNALVFDYADYWRAPVLVLMGGGYADPIEASALAHADLFVQAAQRYQDRLARAA